MLDGIFNNDEPDKEGFCQVRFSSNLEAMSTLS